MKFTVKKTGWVPKKEKQEETLRECDLTAGFLREAISEALYPTMQDCKDACGYLIEGRPKKRTVIVTVEIIERHKEVKGNGSH